MLPRCLFGFVREGGDLHRSLNIGSLNVQITRGGVYAAFWTPAERFRRNLRRNPLKFDQLNPAGNLFVALQLCQFGAVQVLADLPRSAAPRSKSTSLSSFENGSM